MNFQKKLLATSIIVATTSISAFAEQTPDTHSDIEKIEVVSDFRNTNIQTIPASLSVISEGDIAIRNAQNLEEILAATANVNFSSGSSRARYYQIRGIGERSQFKEPINPSVGLIIDEVDFSGIGSAASLYDVNQVEVFRGPQGTKFGASAMAGVINITTNDPTTEFEGSVKAMVGNYDSASLGLVLSGPASETLGYRFAIEKYVSDGFMENSHLNRDDTQDKDELTVRSKFKYQPSEDLTIDLALFYLDFDNGYDAFSLDNNRNTMSDNPGFDKQQTLAGSVKSEYTGNEHFDFVNIVSFSDSDIDYGYDEDWTYDNFHLWGYSSIDSYFREKQGVTAEFRFLSKANQKIFNDTTQWVFGFYVKDASEDLLREYTYADADLTSEFDATTLAGYVQLDSQLTKKLELTTGLRVEQRDSDYQNSNGNEFDPSDTMVGGKIALSYEVNAEQFVYGSINRGFKAGGVNSTGTLEKSKREFDPEYVMSYELGLKQTFLEGDAFARIAVFYMDRTDMQVSTYAVNKRPDGSEEFLTYLDNAAEGKNQGIEIETSWEVTQEVELYSSLGILDSEYTDFVNGNGEDLSGRDQAHAPEYQYNIGINYYPTEQWLINVNVEGKDKFYFSDSHVEQADSTDLLNASIVYMQTNWQVKLWGRNITDEDYQTRGFYFGNDPRDGYTSKQYYQLGAPAEFGVTLDYSF